MRQKFARSRNSKTAQEGHNNPYLMNSVKINKKQTNFPSSTGQAFFLRYEKRKVSKIYFFDSVIFEVNVLNKKNFHRNIDKKFEICFKH
jgi:hypothetical protein